MTDPDVWSVDARTGARVVPVAQVTSPAEVDAAVRAAASAAPALAEAGRSGRAVLLRAMAGAVEADAEPIVAAADQESALGVTRLRGELGRTAYQLRLFAQVVEDGGYLEAVVDHATPGSGGQNDPATAPAPRPDLRRMLVPVGVVGVFSASNFPLAFSVPGGDTASALAAGCPVVVKAHSAHPLTSRLCAEALCRAAAEVGLPPDVLRVIYGRSAGNALVVHPSVKAVGFTGSVSGGRALFDLACGRPEPIPFYGELGSVNPLVVTPAAAAARAQAIAAGLAASFTQGSGQFCTKPGLAFVPAGAAGDALVAALAGAAGQISAGPLLTAGIRAAFVEGAAARSAHPGVRPVLAAPGEVAPQVLELAAAALDDALVEECFGPLVLVVRYQNGDDLLAALDRVPGSLTGTVHCEPAEARPGELAGLVAESLAARVGRVVFNGFPTGVAVTWAMQHGGPYPSSTFPAHTSVGATAIRRFLRPVCYQDAPAALLPVELREDNPQGVPRRVDGRPPIPA